MAKIKIGDSGWERAPFLPELRIGVVVSTRVGGLLDSETIGEIVDIEFEESLGGGSYSLTYTVKRLKDGFYYEATDLELEKVDPDDLKVLICQCLPIHLGQVKGVCFIEYAAESNYARSHSFLEAPPNPAQ